MVKLSQGVKGRLSLVINASKFFFHWGFVPGIIYLGLLRLELIHRTMCM
jgi:hypothetical protein